MDSEDLKSRCKNKVGAGSEILERRKCHVTCPGSPHHAGCLLACDDLPYGLLAVVYMYLAFTHSFLSTMSGTEHESSS